RARGRRRRRRSSCASWDRPPSLANRLAGDREERPRELRLVDLDDDAEDVLPPETVDARCREDGQRLVPFQRLREIEEPRIRTDAGEDARAPALAAAAGLVLVTSRLEGDRLRAAPVVVRAR